MSASQVFRREMSLDREMVRTGIAERAQAGRSPPLRRRRTREYVPNSRATQRQGYLDQNLHDNSLFTDELTYGSPGNGGRLYTDENMNTISRSNSENPPHLQDILRVMPENSHLSERYQILKAENKILRERLQNALQREMKALKTFKRLAKENRQLKLNLRKYERTLLGFYDDESDSDHSEHPKNSDVGVHLPQTSSRLSHTEELYNGQDAEERDCNQTPSTPPLKTTKSISTSTEDIMCTTNREDKSTSTDDLESFDVKTESVESSDTENNDATSLNDASENICAEPEYHATNLTDATKVQFLQSQLLAIQTQSVQERRKFSDTRRYWTDPMIANNMAVNELQRASSSPSLLDGCGQGTTNKTPYRKDSVSYPKRRVSDGNNPLSPDFMIRSRPSSFHDAELTTVPEVTISPDEERNESEESSRSPSPTSRHSQDDLASSSSSPTPSQTNDDSPVPQRSPRASPLTLDVDAVISASQRRLLSEVQPSPSPQPSPAGSPQLRRKLAHTVSLPVASFGHYLSTISTQSQSKDNTENNNTQTTSRLRRKSIDDDEIYVKRHRETSVSLKFEGDIERENAESLAADIAEFLNNRRKRSRAGTMPSPRTIEEEPKIDDIPAEEDDAVFTHARSTRTRRGSAVVSMPGDHYQMDLHVLNVQREPMGKTLSVIREKKELSGSSTSLNSIDPEKRSRWSILRRNKKMLLLKDKPRQGEDFKESLARMRENPRAIVEHELSEFKNSHWTQLMGQSMERSPRRPRSESTLSDHETKRREAVWELFHSEVVYLMSHLLVLKEVFLEPLKEIQQMGHLQHVDANKIFCNLQDLCEVSTRFAKNLLRVFQNEQPTQFGSTASVVSAFTEFSRKVHPQYQKYCLNYSKALSYLDSLKKDEDFQEFMKWCESNSRCNRLQITDLLVAPLQHLTKYPLLLKNIRKRTAEGDEQHSSLSSIIKAVELSIQELEGKVKSRANYERLQELQSSLVWPSITELDPKTYVPEFLRGILLKQPCESLLASPKRQLLYEGPLTLMENAKVDVYAFLFDDMLLLTRFRKLPQKVNKHPSLVQKLNLTGMTDSPPSTPPVVRRSMSGAQYTVYKQPIPLDRFIIIDAEATHAGSTLKNSFIIIHYSRFKQTVGLYTLQAPSQNLKETWTSTLKAAQSKWSEAVALELAAETEKMSAFQNINEGEVEQDTDPKSPDDTVMSQTQMLSYYKPIESQC
ncbi:uncharacterized protein LOC144653017 isoform X2 [Oculina patagonica]